MPVSMEVPIKDPGVDSEEARGRKKYMVELFGYQADKYDLHDDIIGLGIHRRWVKDIIKVVDKFMDGRQSARVLDLACGTGFVSMNIARERDDVEIEGFDISPDMIKVARARLHQGFGDRHIKCWVGDAELPFGENKYDIIITCFAFRNFANKGLAVENVFRALKPGGVFIIQDLTKPNHQPLKSIYLFAMKYLLPIPARILGIERRAPRYLYNSVLNMPKNGDICKLFKAIGFKNIFSKKQSLGIACIIGGYKPA